MSDTEGVHVLMASFVLGGLHRIHLNLTIQPYTRRRGESRVRWNDDDKDDKKHNKMIKIMIMIIIIIIIIIMDI